MHHPNFPQPIYTPYAHTIPSLSPPCHLPVVACLCLSLCLSISMKVWEEGLWFWQGCTAYNHRRPSQASLSSVVIAEPTPPPCQPKPKPKPVPGVVTAQAHQGIISRPNPNPNPNPSSSRNYLQAISALACPDLLLSPGDLSPSLPRSSIISTRSQP